VPYANFWTTPGMLYTALSRCRTPEGLRLVSNERQLTARIVNNPKLARWA
jgi:hypothetical protein